MSDKVQKALEERKKKRERNSVEAALEARKSRISSDIGSIKNDIYSRYKSAIESYNTTISGDLPTWGADAKAVGDSQRENRIAVSRLKRDVEAYRNYLGDDADTLIKALDEIGSDYDAIYSNAIFYSQFESEDDYNKAKVDWLNTEGETTAEKVQGRKDIYESNKARIAEIDGILANHSSAGSKWDKRGSPVSTAQSDEVIKKLKTEKETLETENRQYERTQGKKDSYYDVTQKEDFKTDSAKRDFSNPTEVDLNKKDVALDSSQWYWKVGKLYDALGNEIDHTNTDSEGNIIHPWANSAEVTDKLGIFLDASEEEKENAYADIAVDGESSWAAAIKDGRDGSWDQLTDQEVAIYYYLLNNDGQEKAYKYLDDMKTELNRRSTADMVQAIDEADGLEKLALNVASVGANIVGGAAGLIENAAYTLQGKDINPYSNAHSLSNFGTAVRSSTAEDLNELTGNSYILGITLGDAYQSVMSGVDSFVAGGVFGAAGAGILLGANAATSEAKRLYEEGSSNTQIAWGGLLAGAAEMIFEKVSIDKLINMGDSKTIGQFVKNALIQGGVEASEEAATEIANTITDAVVRGSQSDFSKNIQAYMEEGSSQGEATWKAIKGVLGDTWKAAAGGFISGGGMGAVQSGINYSQYNSAAKQHGQQILENDGYNALKALALDVSGASKGTDANLVKKFAKAAESKTTAKNVGKLSDAVETLRTNQNLSDITSELKSAGLSNKEAKQVAQYMSDTIDGKGLSEKDQQNFENILSENDAVLDAWNGLAGNESASHAVNKRNEQHILGRKGIVKTESGFEASDNAPEAIKKAVEAISSGEENKPYVAKNVELEGRVSTDGQTVRNSTGEAVVIDKSNPIAKVVEENGETVAYYNTNLGEVESSDINYSSESEGLLHESFLDMNPAIANAAIKAYDGSMPVQTFINGMREGILLYGKHNFQGVGVDISTNSNLADLSQAYQVLALKLGRQLAEIETSKVDKALKSAIRTAAANVEKTAKGNPVTKGTVTFEEGVKPKTAKQKASVIFAEKLAAVTGIQIVFYDSKVNPKHRYADADGASNSNTIWLDMRNSHDDAIAYTLSHEFVHFAKKWSPSEFKVFADFMVEQFAAHSKSVEKLVREKMDEIGTTDWDYAFEEVVADACERMLLDSNAMEKLAQLQKKDPNVFEKFMQHIKDLLAKLRSIMADTEYTNEYSKELQEMEDVLERFYELFENMAVDAVQNFQEASLLGLDENTDIFAVEDTTMFSYKSLANAAGFEAIENEDGTRAFMRNGKKVSKVTVEDIEISPIGALINFSLEKGDIDEENADRQKQMFADICTVACKTNDFAMTMQFVGSAVFTGMKANADAQYGTTYDFPSICTKTQAVIDAMSARMVKLGRGLNSDEILHIYNEVFSSGNPVPCPECYVFSRWIGIGGLLDNIKSYQDYYGKMKPSEVAEIYEKMRAEVKAFADEQGITYGKAKGALTSKLTKEFNKLTEKIEKAENQGEKVSEKDRKRLAEIEPKMKTVKAMTWIEKVYFEGSSLTKVRKNFAVPNEILFDLNRGEEFATKYPEAWAFRTTQGAGYGKAITPYADAALGEGIHATQNLSNTIKGKANGNLNNLFLQQRGTLDSKAKRVLEGARFKQLVQAFLGGQRFQSTSDARYENASDYLIAALEMQAMQGMVQVYTKVDGAVPAFSTWGFSINQSLMPLGGGIDAKGNLKDTSVGGMSPEVAFKNRENHESAGTITIGVNDRHIRALIAEVVRDFVIPYHASGGKANLIAEFRRVQDKQASKGTFVRSSDYSKTQSDKVLSDTVLEWMGKTHEEIEQIHKVREARIAILTRGKPNMEVVRGNKFLSALYEKLNGGEWDGVKIAKGKIEHQIFPNEFWDHSVTYENSKKITEDYLEYCEDLGFLHRFSGMTPSNGMLVPVNGYDENGNRVQLTDLAYKYDANGNKTNEVEDFFWKLITDRRMYDNDGNYLPQKRVVLNDTTTDTVTSFAKHNAGREYNKGLSLETASRLANEDHETIVEGVTDIVNMAKVKKQQKKSAKETYSAIGKEILQYAEGNKQPDLTLVEIVNERTGKKEKTITHYGDRPKGYVPKKIAYCYKLFEQHPDGSLHALFAGAGEGQPIGEWVYAQGFPYTDSGVKGMNLRERYGWHLSAGLPSAPHLMSSKSFERGYPSKNAFGHPKGSKRVWVRMAYDATNDYNSLADSTVGKVGKGDIFGLAPFGGYYSFKENNQSEWVISSGVKIDKILSEEERQQILREAGYDEYEAWRLKYQATAEEKAEREALQKRPQKVKDAEFTASALAMREKIKSRIIDNPELKAVKPISVPGTNKTLSQVFVDNTLNSFGIENLGNYEQVQERVFNTLSSEGFFNGADSKRRVDINEESGMVVETNKRGIDETFCLENYGRLGRFKKVVKLATIRELPNAIKYGHLVTDNVRNEHGENRGTKYAYIKYDAQVDGTDITIKITVRKSSQKNMFWVHSFEAKENVSGTPADTNDGVKTGFLLADIGDMVSQNDPDVKFQKKKLTNRTILANALESAIDTSTQAGQNELSTLKKYQDTISKIEELESHLAEVSAEIKELSFSKGKRDTARLNALGEEKRATASRISTYDRRLLSLEATKPLKDLLAREKELVRKRTEQKGEEAMAAVREKNMEVVREIMARTQEARRKAIEARGKTAIKRKIRKVIRELDKILTHGDKKRNVKEDMKGFVSSAITSAEVLFTDNYSNEDMLRNGVGVIVSPEEQKHLNEAEAILSELDNISYDGSYEAMLAGQEKENDLKGKLSYRMSKLKDTFARERIRLNEAEVSSVLNSLAEEYAKLQNSEHQYVKVAFHENVYNYIKMLQEDTGGTKIKDMSLSQLESLYKAYTMVMTTVRDVNKAFVASKSVDQLVEKLVTEFEDRKMPKNKAGAIARNISNMTGWNYEKLHYALDRIGSETLTELFTNLANSENIVMADVIEAKKEQARIIKKYGYNDWKVDRKIDKAFADNTGKEFHLTLGELMSLYAYSRREGAWNHIEYGGFVFGKSALTDVESLVAYKLTKAQCEAITNTLTNEQKKFVEEMQTFLSDTMGGKGNEVSMLLYGVEMFGEKNYFPIHVAGQFMANAQEAQAKEAAGFGSMTNAGFTQAQNKKAKAPFVMESFMDVWVDHVNEMSRYHGTVPALEDIRKVMNYSHYSNSFADSTSVKAIMENKFGKQAVAYFNDLYQEANSGAITDKLQKTSHKWLSKFRKNSVAYSLSVLIQQPSSISRAYAVIPKKYFRGLRGVGALPIGVTQAVASKWTKSHNQAYAEMMKYAPGVTMSKEIGGFDTASGNSIRSYLKDTGKNFLQKMKTETWLGRGKAFADLVDDNPIANLPNVADKIAWIEIWYACKREAVKTHKDLAPNSEAFMEQVGKRFTEVIRATQVYDSIFAKSPLLKSKNIAVQYLVSFMNEPNTTANMVESAARALARGEVKKSGRIVVAVLKSIAFCCVLKSIIYALRDDDEDETYIEKYTGSLVNNLLNDITVFNYIPIARDVWSISQGYDVERPDMAIVSDAITSLAKVLDNMAKDTSDMTEAELEEWDKKITEEYWKLAESVCAYFGIPVKNVRREIDSIMDHARIAHKNSGKTSWSTIAYAVEQAIADASPVFARPDVAKTDRLYDAIVSGDQNMADRLKGQYKNQDAVDTAIRKALRENDPRIREAAQAEINGNPSERVRIAREIVSEGFFSQDNIVKAINAEVNAMAKNDGSDTSSEGDEENEVESYYSASDINLALEGGDTATAKTIINDLVKTKVANGSTEKKAKASVKTSVSRYWKPLYKEASDSERARIRKLLHSTGLYGSASEVVETCRDWLKED